MLLLNIGPKSDGTITDEETTVLKEIGAWLKINGEGIYETIPWRQFGEGNVNNSEGSFQDNDEKLFTSEDYRFTYKNGFLYAFCMRPDTSDFCIKSLKIRGSYDFVTGSISVLGNYKIINTNRDKQGLFITLDKKPDSDTPLCFKIEII